MFTSLIFHPKVEHSWIPNDGFLEKLLTFMGVNEISIDGYKNAIYWDREQKESFSFTANSISEAISALRQKRKGMSCFLYIQTCRWSHEVFTELDQEDYYKQYSEYVPVCAFLNVGKHTLPDIKLARTQYILEFSIGLGGDGMPNDLEGYLRNVVYESDSIKRMQNFLIDNSKIEWVVSYKCNY